MREVRVGVCCLPVAEEDVAADPACDVYEAADRVRRHRHPVHPAHAPVVVVSIATTHDDVSESVRTYCNL